MRVPSSRLYALLALLTFVALVILGWQQFLEEFPKDGTFTNSSPSPTADGAHPSDAADDEARLKEILESGVTGDEDSSSSDRAGISPVRLRRLDDEFAQISTKLPILNEGTKELPRPPFLIDGCEGEGCGIVQELALTCESRFVTDPHSKGFLAFTLPANTRLKKARIFTLVRKVGSTRLHEEKKDIVVLSYSANGDWLTWEDGEFGSYSETQDGNPRNFRAPVRESWIYVQDEEGRTGWMKVEAQKEGQPPPECPFKWGV